MRLLLTNDDGLYAEGIHTLARALCQKHDVVLVAPDSERSGNSQKITIRTRLNVRQVQIRGLEGIPCYETDGTPADCTRIGLYWLEGAPFDAVITGINHGSNIGTDVLYSGTVGAALEAAMQNKPALAVSLAHWSPAYFPVAAQYAALVVDSGILTQLKRGTILNLNVPAMEPDQIHGIKWVRHGYNDLNEVVDRTQESALFHGIPRVGRPVEFEDDFSALDAGWASLTPLNLDLNDEEALARLSAQYRFETRG